MSAPGSPAKADWALSLSRARQNSCLRFPPIEPCVNKAASHLRAIRERIVERQRAAVTCKSVHRASFDDAWLPEESEEDAPLLDSRTATPKPILKTDTPVKKGESGFSRRDSGSTTPRPGLSQRSSVSIRDRDPKQAELCIEGVQTGTVIVKKKAGVVGKLPVTVGTPDREDDWSDAFGVVAAAIELVGRLEGDWEEAMQGFGEERERVQQLQGALDTEAERRLDLLPRVVQAEHEECSRDIQELKWHVGYEGRQLARTRDSFRLLAERNAQLLKEVAHLAENCPLLEEKLILESDNISLVARKQQETADHLHQRCHKLTQEEERWTLAHSRAEAEYKQNDQSVCELEEKLKEASEQLEKARDELTAVSRKISDAQRTITGHQHQANLYDKKRGDCNVQCSAVESRVGQLRDELARLEMEHRKKEERNSHLREQKEGEHGTLESSHVLLLAALQAEEGALREARDSNEDMEQEIDTHREKTAEFKQQTQDNAKSVERAKKELVRLDQQLQVSMAQYSRVRERNCKLTAELKEKEMKAGDLEHTLKSTVEILQKQLKEETRNKITFEGKVKADTAELDKLKVEGQKAIEETEKRAQETEEQSHGNTELVARLEASRSDHQQTITSLRSQLEEVRAEHSSAEQELGRRVTELTPREEALRVEVQEKVAIVEKVSERIGLLESRLEDVVKSYAMVEKMERATVSAVEKLDVQAEALKERVKEERQEEESWKKEFKEIEEFSSDAEERHEKYLTERQELLQKHQVDLCDALAMNVVLAESYHKLQCEFIAAKTLALRVLGRKLDLETSLKDHKQLLAFQSQMYSSMIAYYEHRGGSSRRGLSQFCKQSKENLLQLRALQTQFDSVVKLMQEFLECGLHRARVQADSTDSSGRSTAVKTVAKTKTVTFSVPVTCET